MASVPISEEPIASAPPYDAPAGTPHENILFLSSREFDRATIAASSAAPGLPASFLQDLDPDKRWRTTSKVGQYLNITLFRPVACNALAIAGHNFTDLGVVRIRGALTLDGLATPAVDTGWLSVWPATGKPDDEDWPSWSSLVRWENDERVALLADRIRRSRSRDHVDRDGAHLAGPQFPADSQCRLRRRHRLRQPGRTGANAVRQDLHRPARRASRRVTLPFSAANKNDILRSFYELQRYCGLARDFFVSIDPAETTDFHRLSMQALFASTTQFEAQPVFDNSGQCWRQILILTEPL